MMTFINPAMKASYCSFWDKLSRRKQIEALAEKYILRRLKDVMVDMVEKHETAQFVSQYPAELLVYDVYEGQLQPILRQFGQLMGVDYPIDHDKLKVLFRAFRATMTSMRGATIRKYFYDDFEPFSAAFSEPPFFAQITTHIRF